MRYYTNDSKPSKREILTEDDIQRKISQIKENRERRKQGLDYISTKKTSDLEQEQKVPEEQEEEEAVEQKPPQLSQQKQENATKGYAFLQSQMQNQMALFQAEKFSQIAAAARKDKHIIYQFADKPEPPKLGEKKNTKANLVPIDVYYNELPNDIHYELDAMRAQVADLQYVKSLQTPTYDGDGRMSPAALNKNDPDRTGVSDKTFAKISEEIDKLNKKIAAKMALWYYGIPADLLPKLETNSLSNALEAGLYREIYGIVNTSKNSAVY